SARGDSFLEFLLERSGPSAQVIQRRVAREPPQFPRAESLDLIEQPRGESVERIGRALSPPLVPSDRAPNSLENQNRSERFRDKIKRTQPQRAHRLTERSVGGYDDDLERLISIAEP